MNTNGKKSQSESAATINGSNTDSKVVIKKKKGYKKKIAALKQQYSIKGVKYFRGTDGYGFNANLYLDKKKIAFTYDAGSGALIYNIDVFDKEAINNLMLAIDDIGLVPRKYPDWPDWESKYSMEDLVDELINDYEGNKKLKRKFLK